MLATILSLLAANNLATAPADSPALPSLLPPPAVHAHPVKTGLSLQPQIGAKAVLSIDLESGTLLYGQNADTPLPMASLTKLMTIMVILQENSLDETVTVDPRATKVEPSKMYLLAYEKITVGELIKAIIVKSANDAALALAYHNAGELENFVA
jgi:D-alanyl-D-alanine carboxypeptidase